MNKTIILYGVTIGYFTITSIAVWMGIKYKKKHKHKEKWKKAELYVKRRV